MSRNGKTATPQPIEGFIARWQGRVGGQERANYGMFLTEPDGSINAISAAPRPEAAYQICRQAMLVKGRIR